MINTRLEIKEFILKVENKFPVNQWKVGSIHLWPYIRLKLFFYLINSIEKTEFNPKTIKTKGLIISFKTIYKNFKSIFHYLSWIISLPKKENLFVAADAHRVDYRNARFNRYFDILIEKYRIQKSSIYFEYGYDTKDQYNKPIVFTFSEALKGFLYLNKFFRTKAKVSLTQYDDFLTFLKEDSLFNEFILRNSNEKITEWATSIFYPKVLFFQKTLHRIKPTNMIILCFYSEDIFALTSAGNLMKIKTIEMQHGPQTDVHLAYSSWFSLPEFGYDMIPKNYWCWDEGSSNIIQEWSKNNLNYSVKVIGNPWIDYWKSKKVDYTHKDYILYSLQPTPLTIEQLFPESIVNFIKENPFPWFIRLHPRQLNEMNIIKKYLEEKQILHLVTINEATNDPLPLLLSNALLHITHFSGTAIEASLFNVFTVLLNEIGVLSFQNLISTQKAVYLDVNSLQFSENLRNSIKNKSQLKGASKDQNDFKEINLFNNK